MDSTRALFLFSGFDDRKLLRYLIFAAYALVAQVVASLYFRVETDPNVSSYAALADFTARKPFQYRVLVPALVHVVTRALHGSREQYFPIYQFLELGATFGTLIAFRAYLRAFLPERDSILLSFAIAFPMLLIHVSDAALRYPSDTPQIFLFILGLIALRKRNWPQLYALLAVDTFNRETSALLILAFAATMWGNIPRRAYLFHLTALTATFAACKLIVNHLFASNPGVMTENHTAYNASLFIQLAHGQPNILATTVFLAVIPAALIAGRRFILPFQARLLWLAPAYGAIMLLVGVLDEVRAYNEMLPVLLTPLLMVTCGLMRGAETPQSAPEPKNGAAPEPQRLAA